MELERDIPFDTPENTVKNIILILQEEANQLGATFIPADTKEGLHLNAGVYVKHNNRSFHISLTYVHSDNLETMWGFIGNGFIGSTNHQVEYDLELLGDDLSVTSTTPPFRWGLYPGGSATHRQKPDRLLDGRLLRDLLNVVLFYSPPA